MERQLPWKNSTTHRKTYPSNRNTVKLYLGLRSDRPATNTLSYDMALKSKVLPTGCSPTNVLPVHCGPEKLHLNGHLVHDKRLLNTTYLSAQLSTLPLNSYQVYGMVTFQADFIIL
jgi:hypothetical protein